MSADPNKKSPRTFQCKDVMWTAFEQMAKERVCSVDFLINDAMREYARQRSYGEGSLRTEGRTDAGTNVTTNVTGPTNIIGSGTSGPPMNRRPSSNPPPPPTNATGRTSVGIAPPPTAGGRIPLVSPPAPRERLPPPPVAGARSGYTPGPPAARGDTTGASRGQSTVPPPPGRGLATNPPPPPAGARNTNTPPPIPGMPGMPGSSAAYRPVTNGNGGPVVATNASASSLSVMYQGEKVPITKDRFVIGRGKQSSDLMLKDPNVSRQHAMVEFQGGAYYMVDMGSTNGIEYNGARIARKQIAEGDVFRICDHDLRFTYR